MKKLNFKIQNNQLVFFVGEGSNIAKCAISLQAFDLSILRGVTCENYIDAYLQDKIKDSGEWCKIDRKTWFKTCDVDFQGSVDKYYNKDRESYIFTVYRNYKIAEIHIYEMKS